MTGPAAATSWRDRNALLGAVAVVIGVGFATGLAIVWPRAQQAAEILLAQDDPAALADVQLRTMTIDRAEIAREIDEALAAQDPELAQSFLDLAASRGVDVPPAVTARVGAAVTEQGSAKHMAAQFATGFVTGEASDGASLSGTVAGDLFVFGDIRDVVREGGRLVSGGQPDRLVLSLAAAGIAVTAATYMSLGSAAPVRAGLTLVKDARKAGRLGAGLTTWAERSAREMIDAEAVQKAVGSASVLRPAATLDVVRTAFRAGQAGEMLRVVKDVGRVGERAGVRGALDTLRLAEEPKDIARAARLATREGSRTRAVLKLLGRGALLLVAGAFNLSMWLLWAAIALFGLLCSIKSAAERVGSAWSRHARRRRLNRQSAALVAAGRAARTSVMPGLELAVPYPIN